MLKSCLITGALLASLMLSAPSRAGLIVSTNGAVNLLEAAVCADQFECNVFYIVENISAAQIFEFVVSTQLAYGSTSTTNGWNSSTPIHKGDWDANYASIGLFTDLFGPDDTHALRFWCAAACSGITTASTMDGFIYESSLPFTEFVALDAQRQVLAGSMVGRAVPEPGTLGLLLAGLIGLGFLRRRRVSADPQQLNFVLRQSERHLDVL